MKKIDLHCHTTASDGIKTPSQLIDYAISCNVEVLAVTDHDTIVGLAEAVEYASSRDFTLITGIEFSIDYSGGSFHLLGLNIDHNNRTLFDKTLHLQDVRDNRIYHIIEDLARHNIYIPVEDVLLESNGGAVGRPHVARTLVRHGYARDINEIFQKYLVKGKPGYVPKERISLPEAVSLIKGAGGIAVIAHPVSLNFRDFGVFESQLRGFIDQGLEGIEVYSSMHKDSEVRRFKELAIRYNLAVTGGSDYHGDKHEALGYYQSDELIPFEIFEPLMSRFKN
jgi:predicted metal-dependent phosphoesterase TrpH